MLELDLVLEPFVNSCYSTLSEEKRQSFQRLLACEDQELFSWFLRREQPEDEEFGALVKQILDFARVPADN